MEWNFRNDNAYHVAAAAAWLLIMFPDMSNLTYWYFGDPYFSISLFPATEHRPYKVQQAFGGKSLLSWLCFRLIFLVSYIVFAVTLQLLSAAFSCRGHVWLTLYPCTRLHQPIHHSRPVIYWPIHIRGKHHMSAYHVNGARYYGPCFDLHSGGILAHPYSRSQLIHSPPLTHGMMQFYMGSPIFHWTDQILAHPCYLVWWNMGSPIP